MHTHYLPYVVNEIAEIKVSYHPYYNISERLVVNSSHDALEIFRHYRDHNTINYREMCFVLFLNNAKEVIGIHEFSKGSDCKTVLSCKQITAIALKTNSAAIVLAHNHTWTSVEPSSPDYTATTQLLMALDYFGILLMDHLIINPDKKLYSFKKHWDL